MFLRVLKNTSLRAPSARVIYLPVCKLSTKKPSKQSASTPSAKSSTAKVVVDNPAPEPVTKPQTWYQKLLAGKSASEAVDDAPPEEPAVLAFKDQVRQHDFRDPMEGILIYGMDTQGYKDMVKAYAPPVGTLVTSLGALSLYTWDVLSMSVWVLAGLVSAANIWVRRDSVVRIYAVTNNYPDCTGFPRHRWSATDVKQITHLNIERIGLPFFDRVKTKYEITPMTRVVDYSFMKDFVFPGDVKEAAQHRMYQRIVVDWKNKRMSLYVDQVRNPDYFNQMMTYVRDITKK